MGSENSAYESATGIGADICPRIDLAVDLDLSIGFGLAAIEDDEDFQGMFTWESYSRRRCAPQSYMYKLRLDRYLW